MQRTMATTNNPRLLLAGSETAVRITRVRASLHRYTYALTYTVILQEVPQGAFATEINVISFIRLTDERIRNEEVFARDRFSLV